MNKSSFKAGKPLQIMLKFPYQDVPNTSCAARRIIMNKAAFILLYDYATFVFPFDLNSPFNETINQLLIG